jgi:hypothetical protein
MSLGDSFVAAGIVHHFADRCEELHVPVNPKFYSTLKTLYQDHPHIKVVSISPEQLGDVESYLKEHRLGRIRYPEYLRTIVNGIDMVAMWDYQMYITYELSYELRYRNFRLPKYVEGAEELYQRLTGGQPYVLVHRLTADHPQGIPIDIVGVRRDYGLSDDVIIIEITPEITDNMMQYVTLIERAEEIHCVPSSFHCLVDSMHDKTNAILFYHDIREKTAMAFGSDWNGHIWKLIRYHKRL